MEEEEKLSTMGLRCCVCDEIKPKNQVTGMKCKDCIKGITPQYIPESSCIYIDDDID